MFETLLAEELLVYVVEELVAEMVEIFLVEKLVVEADVQALSFYSVLYKKSDTELHIGLCGHFTHTLTVLPPPGVCVSI